LEDHETRLREEEAAFLAAKAPKKSKANGTEPSKRKAATQISRGADKLKRANTTGMSKLSSFFQKPGK
jgi:ribonuclease H2 subunit B